MESSIIFSLPLSAVLAATLVGVLNVLGFWFWNWKQSDQIKQVKEDLHEMKSALNRIASSEARLDLHAARLIVVESDNRGHLERIIKLESR